MSSMDDSGHEYQLAVGAPDGSLTNCVSRQQPVVFSASSIPCLVQVLVMSGLRVLIFTLLPPSLAEPIPDSVQERALHQLRLSIIGKCIPGDGDTSLVSFGRHAQHFEGRPISKLSTWNGRTRSRCCRLSTACFVVVKNWVSFHNGFLHNPGTGNSFPGRPPHQRYERKSNNWHTD